MGDPSNGEDVIKMLKDTQGFAVPVTEDGIKRGMDIFHENTPFGTGYVGAVVVEATRLLRERGVIRPKDTIVLAITDGKYHNREYALPDGIKKGRLITLSPEEATTKIVSRTLDEILAA